MTRGKIKSFDHSKGSGVIEQQNGGEEVSVHFSQVKSKSQRTLQAGQLVQFELTRDAAGLRATNIEILDATATPATSAQQSSVAAPQPAPANRNSRAKTKLWPFGIGGVAAAGALLVALSSRQSVQSPQPPTAATSPARVVSEAAKPAVAKSATAKSLVQKPIVVQAPPPLPGEQFAQTRLRELSPEETGGLTPDQVQYALNEIYARHGYRFATSGPRRQFSRFAWYKPVKGQSAAASWKRFSDIEKRNEQRLLGARSEQREEQTRQRQIAQSYQANQKLLAEQEQQDQMAQRQVAQARRNEPEPVFTSPESSHNTMPDSSDSSSAETPDLGSSGDFTATGKQIFTGPRGGRYHYSKSGKKVYERRH